MSKKELEKFIEDSKDLFPFNYGKGEQRVNIKDYRKQAKLARLPENFDDVCKERNIEIKSKDYELLKLFFGCEITDEASLKEASDLALRYFPEFRLGSVKSNSKRQEDNSDYVTKNNYKIDASKVVRLKDLPSGAANLSIIATSWPGIDLRGDARIEAINAFWDMVCNKKEIKSVVCLSPDPQSKNPADKYYDPKAYRNLSVLKKACYKVIEKKEASQISGCKNIKVYDLTVRREFEDGKTKDYVVKWYHYTQWPDGQTPIRPAEFEKFVKYLDEEAKVKKLVVHCLAGAGRTGVLSACLYALRSKANNAAEIIKSLRTYRTQMVQQQNQFEFVYKFILRNIDNVNIDYKDDLKKYLESRGSEE